MRPASQPASLRRINRQSIGMQEECTTCEHCAGRPRLPVGEGRIDELEEARRVGGFGAGGTRALGHTAAQSGHLRGLRNQPASGVGYMNRGESPTQSCTASLGRAASSPLRAPQCSAEAPLALLSVSHKYNNRTHPARQR